MTFRTRLLAVFLPAVLLPMFALVFFVRNEMTNRLTAQYERRLGSLVAVIEEDLDHEREAIKGALEVIRNAVIDDNSFRQLAVDQNTADRRYLLDYAANAMRLTQLSMLQIQDETGRIISSGHFRNEYDRLEPKLPGLLAQAPGAAALVQARAPGTPFLALARVDSFNMGGKRFTIVAGVKIEQSFLARLSREDEITVLLVHPDGVLTPGAVKPRTGNGKPPAPDNVLPAEEIVRVLSIPVVDSRRGELSTATFHVTHKLTELHALRDSIDRWFLVAAAVACVLTVILVTALASRISRPLVQLADKTSRVDLDRLDIDFATQRRDEIGVLSRLLGAMVGRLRASTIRIKEAERRATLGELARQVNHDIKNGLTPIRNVFRHLSQLSRENPAELPGIFRERYETLESSVSYLENLASNYARLSPGSSATAGRACDVNDIVRQVTADLRNAGQNFEIHQRLDDGAVVLADPVALRRILENLLNNAIDSLGHDPGRVTVSTSCVPGDEHRPVVTITVEDTGTGMVEEQRSRVFDDFYTTKEKGTGLGLSIVRRLVMDLDGTVRVESTPGAGSRFMVELPGLIRE